MITRRKRTMSAPQSREAVTRTAGAHAVQTCRWGTPTLFLPWPSWYDASEHEWSCTRRAAPAILVDPAICLTCAHWAPVERQPAHPPQQRSAGCLHRHALVFRRDADGGDDLANRTGAAYDPWRVSAGG